MFQFRAMNRRRFETVADLHRERCELLILCTRCKRGAGWAADQVMRLVFRDAPWTAEDMTALPIAEVVAKARCRLCGGKDIEWHAKQTNPLRLEN